jgi:hypothetical protein
MIDKYREIENHMRNSERLPTIQNAFPIFAELEN